MNPAKNNSLPIQHCLAILASLLLLFFLAPANLQATSVLPTKATEAVSKTKSQSPDKPNEDVDELNRSTPRSTVEGFFSHTAKGDFSTAARYLDLRYLPRSMKDYTGDELARKLKIILDRALWIDPEALSPNPEGAQNDGLPPYRDRIGRIKTPDGTIDILLQRVPSSNGTKIWKFSNRTIANIPKLYTYYGYRPFEEKLSKLFPDIQFAGWQLWQWTAWFVMLVAAFFAAWLPTWIISILVRRSKVNMSYRLASFIAGPVRILLWLALGRAAAFFLKPSAEVKVLLNAGTITIIGGCWAAISAVDVMMEFWRRKLEENGRGSTIVLLKPLRTMVRSTFITIAFLMWLDNLGVKVSAILAGLGVGGLAVALAAQDILKNLLGTAMILADRPYNVGERIVVNGYDGEVEEIGLRSTKIRLLNGHEVSVPNDLIERTEVENIGRRPHIRRRQNIRLALDTPSHKVEQAVQIIRSLLENHEGMKEGYPPRVYFDTIRDDALNIVMFYWYHPPEFWDFLAFNQRINSAILREFDRNGIRLAPPTTANHVSGETTGSPLSIETQDPYDTMQGEAVT